MPVLRDVIGDLIPEEETDHVEESKDDEGSNISGSISSSAFRSWFEDNLRKLRQSPYFLITEGEQSIITFTQRLPSHQ